MVVPNVAVTEAARVRTLLNVGIPEVTEKDELTPKGRFVATFRPTVPEKFPILVTVTFTGLDEPWFRTTRVGWTATL